jgi:PAS domain S-box-containing protein
MPEGSVADTPHIAQAILDAVPTLIAVHDAHGALVMVNRTLADFVGKPAEELIGQPLATLPWLSPEDTPLPLDLSATPNELREVAATDGLQHWLWTTAKPLGEPQNGALTLLVSADITEQKRADDTLAEERNLLKTLMNSLPDYIFIKDTASRYVTANLAHAQLLGASCVEELIGKTDFEFFSTPSTLPFFTDEQRVMRTGTPLLDRVEIINRDFEDKQRWVLASKLPLYDTNGHPWGLIGISRDVTALKKVEAELRTAKEVAEAATHAKSDFLATMSHEIRTPMNAVIGMTSLLLDSPLNAEQAEFVDTIRISGENLLAIINDILDFSKIESGRMELEHRPFNLVECIEDTLDLFATRAAEKGIELALELQETVPLMVIGDQVRLRQVLVNLVGNAVKFTAEGEVVLSVTAAAGDARRHLQFAVRDTGIGIPQNRVDRLFQTFSQVDSSTTRRYGGTGLGLAISKRLVEMMGGALGVKSTPGAGSTFTFDMILELPGEDAQHPQSVRPDMAPLDGKQVLIVDDNRTNLTILTHQLERWGITVTAFTEGSDAVAALGGATRFDAAVLDVMMPGMDGLSLAEQLRRGPEGRDLPIVLLSSSGDNLGSERMKQLKVAGTLSKPVKTAQLFEALSQAISGAVGFVRARRKVQSQFEEHGEAAPLRILLAEDNVINQKVALRILQRLGYAADVAETGLAVLEALCRQDYDVVLMDVQMPELNGLDATRRIRAELPPERQPYIIALTADAVAGYQTECLASGMNDYITKPVRIDALVGALQQVPHPQPH